ncbi:cupin domain-containing protein [Thalassotalea atypica]|uniref:ribosomal protein uL16 3-hydroxylase n=1 Tax=Thalassotalea atypica TaxID=2054316 RepID=UPI0025724D96|nr:cupin domain-containing protein [Thalassotalea atypica]
MILDLNGLTPQAFLDEYWQKKPFVIRQGFKDFQDILSPEELAGLACEERVESRRVFKENNQWQAEFGPFESYDHLGSEGWTFIVQALNNWVPEGNDLIKCFDFIPRWRLDDLMVSYGTPGGGVGPHIDLYDVFICQGSGSRRWRVGSLGPHKEFAAHPALLHTEAFDPIIDVELKTGDILYIPPGFPHDGVSLENSMSFSVGFRTDSAQNMHSALADHMIDHGLAQQQISDPVRKVATQSGLIIDEDLEKIKQHLFDALDDNLIASFAGEFLTRSKCPLDIDEDGLSGDEEFTSAEIVELLDQQPLVKLGGVRCLYFESYNETGDFYVNGEKITLPKKLRPLIPAFCNEYEISIQQLSDFIEHNELLYLLTRWVNNGYWYFEE